MISICQPEKLLHASFENTLSQIQMGCVQILMKPHRDTVLNIAWKPFAWITMKFTSQFSLHPISEQLFMTTEGNATVLPCSRRYLYSGVLFLFAVLNTESSQNGRQCRKKELTLFVQWNLNASKDQGSGKICLLYWGFVISVFFFTSFTITWAKNTVCYTKVFVK